MNAVANGCTMTVGQTYYYYIWLQKAVNEGLVKLVQQHWPVQAEDLDFKCEEDDLSARNGKQCWDEHFTCLSCCNNNIGLPPWDRECWIPGSLTREDCCGTVDDNPLPRDVGDDTQRNIDP
jgi:hypothetical protein